MITTTSALGRSSIYNRISIDNFKYWHSLGYTKGSGEFHFSNGVYEDIRTFAEKYCIPTAKQDIWGSGFRNKREVVRKCLLKIGLSDELLFHGIKREIYVAPLGKKAKAFLQGKVNRPAFYDWPSDYLTRLFKDRWLYKRASKIQIYQAYDREMYRIWKNDKLEKEK